MIIAKGIKNKKELTVKYEKGKFLFNGEENKILLFELDYQLKSLPLIFGTYCAEKPYDKLNIIGVLREHFFDEYAEITTDEEIKTNWEDKVY